MSTEVMTTVATTDAVTTDVVIDTPAVVVTPIVGQLNMMAELLDTLAKTSKALTVEMKTLTRDVNKMRITAAKGTKRVKKVVDPDVPRKLGALEKPVPITNELAVFLGLETDTMFSRQFITQTINKYVKQHDLQNPENRRYILLESEEGLKLKALLRDPDQPLTFFNIQRYLKVHYPKVESEPVPDTPKQVGKSVKVDTEPTQSTVQDPPQDGVVQDTDTVDESSEAPKKKIVRKVVKKTA